MDVLFDKIKIFIGFLFLAGILLAGGSGLMQSAPKILGEQGKVAGTSVIQSGLDEKRADIQEQIDVLKHDITQIKPENLKQQDALEKVLKDLEGLKEQASQGAKVLDVKGNLCEEAKKRFCE